MTGGVPGVTFVDDFFRRDLPGVKPAALLGLELAGEEYMFCFQATVRPGVVAGFLFVAEDPMVG